MAGVQTLGRRKGLGVRVESGYRKPRGRLKGTQLTEEVGASSSTDKKVRTGAPKNFKLRDGVIGPEFSKDRLSRRGLQTHLPPSSSRNYDA